MRVLIIVVCFIAVSATVMTIIIGKKSFEGLVVDKPYETGLAWDVEQAKKTSLNWTMVIQNKSFHTGQNRIDFTLRDKDGSPVRDAVMMIRISRPSTARFDRSFQVSCGRDARCQASVVFPRYGLWDIILDVTKDHQTSILQKRIFADAVDHP